MSNFNEMDWTDKAGLVLLIMIGLGTAVAIAQSPGCVVAAEHERTQRYKPIIIVQPCEEEPNVTDVLSND